MDSDIDLMRDVYMSRDQRSAYERICERALAHTSAVSELVAAGHDVAAAPACSAEEVATMTRLIRALEPFSDIARPSAAGSEVKLTALIEEIRREARDMTEAGEDASVMRGWASTIAAHLRGVARPSAAGDARDAALDKALRLVNAVSSDYGGDIFCEDIAEGNWFDARDNLNAALTGAQP